LIINHQEFFKYRFDIRKIPLAKVLAIPQLMVQERSLPIFPSYSENVISPLSSAMLRTILEIIFSA